MRLRTFGLSLMFTAAPLLVGCGAHGPEAIRPSATTPPTVVTIARPADGSPIVAGRLAFAQQRYRAPVFGFVSGTIVPYATGLPSLDGSPPVTLALTIYQPIGDSQATRPLVVWIHGGGFTTGARTEMEGTAIQYAQLGYVTASIDDRLDPGSHCVLVQAGFYTGQQYITERARCQTAILTARDDAATAIIWLRAHAAAYGIDTTKVAVGGASAGAITAIHVGETLNTPGSAPPATVQVAAVLAMSGCNYVDGSIDSADAPLALLASGGDPLVPFSCVNATADAAQAVGTPVVRSFFAAESAHAQALYATHQPEVDRAWRQFLIDAFHLS
jgi:acetyl esterase/lipase